MSGPSACCGGSSAPTAGMDSLQCFISGPLRLHYLVLGLTDRRAISKKAIAALWSGCFIGAEVAEL